MNAHETPLLLLDAQTLARMLCLSAKTVRRMDSAGKLPRPLKLSAGCVRWSHAEIVAWIAAGCPPRKEWDAHNDNGRPE